MKERAAIVRLVSGGVKWEALSLQDKETSVEESKKKKLRNTQPISDDIWRLETKTKRRKWRNELRGRYITTDEQQNIFKFMQPDWTQVHILSKSCSQWGATTTEKTSRPASPETPQDENPNFSEKVSGDVMWHFYFLLDEEIIFTVFSIPTRPPRSDDLMPNNQQTDSKPQRISRDGCGHGPLWVRPAERYYRFHSLMKPRYQPVSIILSGPQDKVR